MPEIVDTSPSLSASTLESADALAVEGIARGLLPVAHGWLDDATWVAAARREAEKLPLTLRRTLREFRRASGESGVLVLRGLPLDESTLPQTPRSEGSIQRRATVPAALLMLAACCLGEPAAYLPEKSGALVQDVVPVPGQEDFQGNAGSAMLTFHTENAFHSHRPDFVLVLCLRADHEQIAGLRTASIREIRPLLPAAALETLARPEFVTAAPQSFGGVKGAQAPHAVLSGAADDPDLRVNLATTRPLTTAAAAALTELDELFQRTAQTAYLLPGDLAVVDNRVAVHGRTAFQPRYDGRDRWLQRTFALSDIRRSRAHRPGDGYVIDC
jgi:L-asparagine oxygenase